jgi:hypothetical protein
MMENDMQLTNDQTDGTETVDLSSTTAELGSYRGVLAETVKQQPSRANVILPPAFLDPANRDRLLAEKVKRLADRPLKNRPTISYLGCRRR